MTYTHIGEPTTGKPETYTQGPFTAKTTVIEIDTYDSAADGNGEAFDVSAELGLSRVVDWDVKPEGGDANVVQWDNTNEAFRVYEQANDGTGTAGDPLVEIAGGTAINLQVRVTFIGAGAY